MILFKHSHSNHTCFLVQTLRSWNGHCSYDVKRMANFFQKLCIRLYTCSYAEALAASQAVDVYHTINNLMWGRNGKLPSLNISDIKMFGSRGVPVTTSTNTYVLSMFKSTPLYRLNSTYAHITRVLNSFEEDPNSCMAKLTEVDLPTTEMLTRYVKVGTYLRQLLQSSFINRDSNVVNSEHISVIPIRTIGAYHSEEQIENWRYYIEQAFTREMWEAYATYFNHTLSISNTNFTKDKLKALQYVLSNFTPKVSEDQEFTNYVNV